MSTILGNCISNISVYPLISDARRFIFRQPAAACPKWLGVAAFRRRGTKFYQNLCFNFQAQKIVTYVRA